MSNHEQFYRDLGAKLATVRFKTGLSQEDLARMVGIAHGTLVNIELGRQHPRLPLVARLAAELGVSIENLLPEDRDAPVIPIEPKPAPDPEPRRSKRWRKPFQVAATWTPVTPDDHEAWARIEAASVTAQFGRLAACATLARARRFLDEGLIAKAVGCLVQALDESLEAQS